VASSLALSSGVLPSCAAALSRQRRRSAHSKARQRLRRRRWQQRRTQRAWRNWRGGARTQRTAAEKGGAAQRTTSFASVLTPLSNSSATQSTWPLYAAQCSGVLPPCVHFVAATQLSGGGRSGGGTSAARHHARIQQQRGRAGLTQAAETRGRGASICRSDSVIESRGGRARQAGARVCCADTHRDSSG
jgi:hypothetical protein